MKGAQYARDRKTAPSPPAGPHRPGRSDGDRRGRGPRGHPGQRGQHQNRPPRPASGGSRQQAVFGSAVRFRPATVEPYIGKETNSTTDTLRNARGMTGELTFGAITQAIDAPGANGRGRRRGPRLKTCRMTGYVDSLLVTANGGCLPRRDHRLVRQLDRQYFTNQPNVGRLHDAAHQQRRKQPARRTGRLRKPPGHTVTSSTTAARSETLQPAA